MSTEIEKTAEWLERKIINWLQEQDWPNTINSQHLIEKMAELFGDEITTQSPNSKQKDSPSRIHAFLNDLAETCRIHCCAIYLQNEEGERVVRFNNGKVYEELEAYGNPHKAEASVWDSETKLHIREEF